MANLISVAGHKIQDQPDELAVFVVEKLETGEWYGSSFICKRHGDIEKALDQVNDFLKQIQERKGRNG